MERPEKRYCLKGWQRLYFLTAEEIHERVMNGEKCEYERDWIASAVDLVGVCMNKSFPEEYAQDIKIVILNYFANDIRRKYPRIWSFPRDKLSKYRRVIQICYNSLSGTKGEQAKRNYLTAFMYTIVKRYTKHNNLNHVYYVICDEWVKAKVEQYIKYKNISFNKLSKILYEEINVVIEKAKWADMC